MNDGGRGLTRTVHQEDHRSPAPKKKAAEEAVSELSADDDAWLGNEPSSSLDLSWVEDDLQSTPVDERTASDTTSSGPIPAAPEMKLTPPPAARKPIRRPVVERVRPRAEIAAAARVSTPPRRASVVVVQALPSRRGMYIAYAGAVLAGIASGVAVLLLGQ